MKQLSSKQLNQLRDILQDGLGLTYTDEEIYSHGLAIVRFVLCKVLHDFNDDKSKDICNE